MWMLKVQDVLVVIAAMCVVWGISGIIVIALNISRTSEKLERAKTDEEPIAYQQYLSKMIHQLVLCIWAICGTFAVSVLLLAISESFAPKLLGMWPL
jgi:hypothetical protein